MQRVGGGIGPRHERGSHWGRGRTHVDRDGRRKLKQVLFGSVKVAPLRCEVSVALVYTLYANFKILEK